VDEAILTESERQQRLLAVLWAPRSPDLSGLVLRPLPGPARQATPRDGVMAYRRNAHASAVRALALVYPVLHAVVGAEGFHALAAALWRDDPPTHGDLGAWGDTLPDWLVRHAPWPELPYVADLAQLEWAVHQASRAADDPAPSLPEGLALLADTDPTEIEAQWREGVCVVCSAWPVVTMWHAHQPDPLAPEPERLAAAREALAHRQAESALVWRPGWQVAVRPWSRDEARFAAGLMAGMSLSEALACAPADFDFEAWLIAALQARWLRAWRKRG
jgi:Putative DNA-binding domain